MQFLPRLYTKDYTYTNHYKHDLKNPKPRLNNAKQLRKRKRKTIAEIRQDNNKQGVSRNTGDYHKYYDIKKLLDDLAVTELSPETCDKIIQEKFDTIESHIVKIKKRLILIIGVLEKQFENIANNIDTKNLDTKPERIVIPDLKTIKKINKAKNEIISVNIK